MVDIEAAVRAAKAFAIRSLEEHRTVDLRLEEIETGRVGDEDVWLVTLSSAETSRLGAPLANLTAVVGGDLNREYKQFAVGKASGEVLSMKVRLFPVPLAS
jgi:hypothetical protein